MLIIDIITILLSNNYLSIRDIYYFTRTCKILYTEIIVHNRLYDHLSLEYLLNYVKIINYLKLTSGGSGSRRNSRNMTPPSIHHSSHNKPTIGYYLLDRNKIKTIAITNHSSQSFHVTTLSRFIGQLNEITLIKDTITNSSYNSILINQNETYQLILQSINNSNQQHQHQHQQQEIKISYIDQILILSIISSQTSILLFILKIMASLQPCFKIQTTPSSSNLSTTTTNQLRLSANQQSTQTSPLPTVELQILSQLIRLQNQSTEISPVALFMAAAKGYGMVIKTLIATPFYNVNMKLNGCNRNAFFYAANREVALLLLQHRTKVDQPDVYGMLPIHFHSLNGNIEVIKCLLDDSTINAQDLSQNTPLHWSSLKGHLAVVKLLVSSGARFNIVNSQGRYPIHNAALEGHMDLVRYFIELYSKQTNPKGSLRISNSGASGTSIQLIDKENNTPIDLAILHNHFVCTYEMLRYEGVILSKEEIDLTMANKIGSGAFADVYLMQWRQKQVAVKKVKYDRLLESGKSDGWIKSKFILEVSLMVKLSHLSSFVKLYGTVIEPNELYLILEFCAYGSLYNILNTVGNDQMISSLPNINILAASIANGMAYLHGLTPQIIHRDLTSQNILMDGNGVAKIADFGISRFKNEIGDKTMTSIGNPRWRAPEVTKGEKYGEKVDVFGFGMILYEMFTRRFPFHEFESIQASFKIASGERPLLPPYIDSRWAKLITKCWDQSPNNRPSFQEVIAIIQQLPIANIKTFSDPQLSSYLQTQNAQYQDNRTDLTTSDGTYEID